MSPTSVGITARRGVPPTRRTTASCSGADQAPRRRLQPFDRGDLLGKLLAIQGQRERIEFPAKGLGWAVQRFDEALPRLDTEARETIAGMRESHLRSIATCDSVARQLSEQ